MKIARATAALLLVLVLTLGAACGDDDEPGAEADARDSAAADMPAETTQTAAGGGATSDTGGGAAATKPEVKVPDGPPPTELQIEDLVVGTGAEAKPGTTALVHYVGVSYSTKEQFDASWDGGRPFPVQLGTGGVIDGWEQGLPGMKAGGRRQLTIPPDLAYGEQGQGPIKPNETLVFVIDLLSVG